MSLLGNLFGGTGAYVPPVPPSPPPSTAGSIPIQAADPGAGGSGADWTSGGAPQEPPEPAAAAGTAADSPRPVGSGRGRSTGTSIHAAATRADFSFAPAAPEAGDDLAQAVQHTWRMSDIIAAISGGPRAEWLIEAATRPGPVQPGSLMEAIKAVSPAPKQLHSTRLV